MQTKTKTALFVLFCIFAIANASVESSKKSCRVRVAHPPDRSILQCKDGAPIWLQVEIDSFDDWKQAGHTVEISLDGKILLKTKKELFGAVGDVPLGKHSFSARMIDKNGQEVCSDDSSSSSSASFVSERTTISNAASSPRDDSGRGLACFFTPFDPHQPGRSTCCRFCLDVNDPSLPATADSLGMRVGEFSNDSSDENAKVGVVKKTAPTARQSSPSSPANSQNEDIAFVIFPSSGPIEYQRRQMAIQSTWGNGQEKNTHFVSQNNSHMLMTALRAPLDAFPDHQWFFLATDSVFVSVANLQSLAREYDSSKLIHIGKSMAYSGPFSTDETGKSWSLETFSNLGDGFLVSRPVLEVVETVASRFSCPSEAQGVGSHCNQQCYPDIRFSWCLHQILQLEITHHDGFGKDAPVSCSGEEGEEEESSTAISYRGVSAERACQIGSVLFQLVDWEECQQSLPPLRPFPEFVVGIIAGPETRDQARAIVESWAAPLRGTKRLFFFSSTDDTTLGFQDLSEFSIVPCATEHGKLGGNRRFPHLMWHLSKNIPSSIQWIIYVDSDAALNLPATLELLRGYDERERVAFGQLFEHYRGTPHWGGGGGMIFSRKAVDAIVSGIESGVITHNLVWENSIQDNQVESLDMWVAECARDANVTILDQRGFYQYEFMNKFPSEYMQIPPYCAHRAFGSGRPDRTQHRDYHTLFQSLNRLACIEE